LKHIYVVKARPQGTFNALNEEAFEQAHGKISQQTNRNKIES
jgi:hypothetical protein